jgi:RNA polymerase sigma-70 factor, ECF subfamily
MAGALATVLDFARSNVPYSRGSLAMSQPRVPAAESDPTDRHDSADRPVASLGDLELVAIARDTANPGAAEVAFRELVDRYRQRIYGLCCRILRDTEDAEDAAQEAFVKAYRRLDSFRGDSQFFTWLYRVATNVANDHYQARRRRRTVESSDVAIREPVRHDDRERPDRALERQDLREVARRALDRVPPLFRTVLVLREYENLEYREIAEVLDISVGTVMSRLFRARARFRKAMEAMVPSLRQEEPRE